MNRGYKFVLVSLVLAIFLLSLASAATVKIKTLENRTVYVRAVTPDKLAYLDSAQKMSDMTGNVQFILNTNEDFYLFIQIKENGKVIVDKKYMDDPYASSGLVEFEIYPEWVLEQQRIKAEMDARAGIVNVTANATADGNLSESSNESAEVPVETPEENLSITSEDVNKKSGISGFVSSITEDMDVTKTLYYAAGALLVLIIGYFLIMIIRKKGSSEEMEYYPKPKQSEDIRVRKLSEIQKRANEDRSEERELMEAQRKLRDTQRQVNEVKNKDRIDQVKRDIVEKEKELIRLRGGSNPNTNNTGNNPNNRPNYNNFNDNHSQNNNQDRY